MANSGSFKTGNYKGRYLEFSWTEKSQSIANNTTTISWTLKGAGEAEWTYYLCQNIKVTIAGQTVFTHTKDEDGQISLAIGTVVASGEYIFTHNDDGTKSFTAYAEAGIYNWAVNCTGSGTFTLDTIARASQPSLVTWPDSTEKVGDFGVEFSIHMNRKSSAFTHTVRYAYGDRTGTIATGVENGTTWAVPLSFMNDIPSATSASGLIYVDTYNGSTKIGTKYTGFTVTVPASAKPSCTLTLEDTTGVDDIYGSPVQGLSKIKITVNETLAYSSPIASKAITANGAKYTTEPVTTGVLQASGNSVVSATITDKRGRSGSASYTMKVQAYAAPAVTALSVHRCDKDGTENAQGDYIKVTFNATVTSLSSKNTAAYKLRYKKSTATTYTEVTLGSLANKYTVSGGSYTFAADGSSSYDVEVTVTDRHGSHTRATSASTAFTLINWHPAGTGMAIGKVSELVNALEIGLRMYDRFGIHIGNGLASYGGTSNPIDADTTLEHLFLTTVGTPDSRFWYVLQLHYSTKSETGNRVQIAIPYSFNAPIHHRYKYGGNDWSAWVTDLEADDTGWVNATSLLTDDFSAYSASDYPCYRRVGKTVSLSGTVKPAVEIEGSSTDVTIYTLPEGCRPQVATFQLCQGSGNAIWLCGVHTSGKVTLSRYRDFTMDNKYAFATAGAGEWLKFHVVFLTA